jgi:hypothetical protein
MPALMRVFVMERRPVRNGREPGRSKHFHDGSVEPQISPLRCAPVEMTKGRTVLPGRVVAEQEQFLSIFSLWERPSLLCHLDRSVPGFPTSRCSQRPRVRLSVKRAACRASKPRVSTGNPGERSGEISVWMPFLGNVFGSGPFSAPYWGSRGLAGGLSRSPGPVLPRSRPTRRHS